MNVLLVTDAFPPNCGGSGWSTYELARGLRHRGHRILVVQPKPGTPETVTETSYDGLRVLLFGSSAPNVPFVRNYFKSERLIQGPVDFLVSWVLPAIAIVLFWIARQATPGKMAIGARIVDAKTGGKPTAGQLVLRYLGYYVSMIPLMIGMLWIAFDPRKQGWHDKIAGTVVIRQKGGTTVPVRFG